MGRHKLSDVSLNKEFVISPEKMLPNNHIEKVNIIQLVVNKFSSEISRDSCVKFILLQKDNYNKEHNHKEVNIAVYAPQWVSTTPIADDTSGFHPVKRYAPFRTPTVS